MSLAPPTKAASPTPSRYAGEESRDIKALSAQEVDSLLTGKGMGFAKAAELNGYPGPAHVLALAEELELTSEQRTLTTTLFASMEAEAVTVGRALVEAERELDRLFAERSVAAASLSAVLGKIGALQARLRDVHLQAHVTQTGILTKGQSARYARLRGYAAGPHPSGHDRHGHSPDRRR
jgi:hypothetical protein